MKPLLLATLAYLLLSGTSPVSAQPADKAQRREDVRELRTEMRAWFQRSVQPTLLEWKREYDASLSVEDLATLNGLRAEAKAHRAKHLKRHADANGSKAFFERLKPIAERSKDKLRSIFENGKDRIEAWKSEAKGIFENWRESHPDARPGFGPHMGVGPLAMGRGDTVAHMGRHAAIRFMLWDGTMPAEDEGGLGFDAAPTGVNDAGSTLSSPLRIAPLPAENSIALTMQDMQNGPATIEVFTMNGSLVKSVAVTISGNALDEMIDVSSLPAGTYMASVNTTAGRRTSQIVVSR